MSGLSAHAPQKIISMHPILKSWDVVAPGNQRAAALPSIDKSDGPSEAGKVDGAEQSGWTRADD